MLPFNSSHLVAILAPMVLAFGGCSTLKDKKAGSNPNPEGSPSQPPSLTGDRSFDRGKNCEAVGKPHEDSDKSGPDEEPPTLQGLVFNKDVYGPGETLEVLFRAKDNFSGISHINVYSGKGLSKRPDSTVFQSEDSPLDYRVTSPLRLMPDGSFCESSGVLSRFAAEGRYYLLSFSVYDQAGNDVDYRLDTSGTQYDRVGEGSDKDIPTNIPVASFEFRYK